MLRIALILPAFLFAGFFCRAAESDSLDSVSVAQALVLSGSGSANKTFFMVKYEYLLNQVGIQITITREANSKKLDADMARDKLSEMGYGLTFRYYIPRVLKGFYGGFALSSANVFLTTSENGKVIAKDNDFLNLGGGEVGYRWISRNGRLIGEVGFRRMYSFNKLSLSTREYTVPYKPSEQMNVDVWELAPGQPHDNIYFSIGFLF
jgi:hypothetical protein